MEKQHNKMRILLITCYFPPDAHVASHRWSRFSRELTKRGHSITVVAPDRDAGRFGPYTCPQGGEPPPEVEQIFRISAPRGYTCFHVSKIVARGGPRLLLPRIKLLTARLMRKNSRSDMRQATDDRQVGGRVAFQQSHNIQGRFYGPAIQKITRSLFFPDSSWRWADRVASHFGRGRAEPAYDVIIASHPFIGTLRAASLISKRTGVPWIADLRDPIHNDPQVRESGYSKRLKRVEERLLNEASSVISINRHLADMVLTRHRVEIIPQSFSEEPLEMTRGNGAESKLARIAYTGNILEGSRYADFFYSLCRAEFDPSGTEIEVNYLGASSQRLLPFKDALKARGINVRDHGFVDATLCRRAREHADLLLVFGWKGPGYRCVLTGKVFDYLSAGKPIIAIAFRDSALAELVEETGAGIVLDSEEEIVEFFRSLKSDPAAVLARAKAARNEEKLKAYTTPFVVDKLEAILAKAASASRSA